MDSEKVVPLENKKRQRRKGWTAPHDGGNVSHYLGNDDYSGASLPEEKNEEVNLEGKVAKGNLELTEEDLFSEEDKRDGKS